MINYKIPSKKELEKLIEENILTEKYDAIVSSFKQVPYLSKIKYILVIGSVNFGKYDGEWWRNNKDSDWERPDFTVRPEIRAMSSGRLKQ